MASTVFNPKKPFNRQERDERVLKKYYKGTDVIDDARKEGWDYSRKNNSLSAPSNVAVKRRKKYGGSR